MRGEYLHPEEPCKTLDVKCKYHKWMKEMRVQFLCGVAIGFGIGAFGMLILIMMIKR